MNFNPSLIHGSTTTLSPFRFWCQKVLPLTYDNSLSYYELLCKVVEYLNETMVNVNTIGENTNALYQSYLELVEYVNTYFDNLDVQEEINNKLDAMAESGELGTIISERMPIFDVYAHLNFEEELGAQITNIINEKSSSYTLYMKKASYALNTPITINRNDTILICDGNISSASDAIVLNASSCILKIKSITNSVSALKLVAENISVGNNMIDVSYIANCENGILLYADNDRGVLNNYFNLCRMNNNENGIVLKCGDNGVPFVNQNIFYNGWVASPALTASKGVVFIKGENQIDEFNGNNFNNMSFETTRYMIDIEFAKGNTFNNIRFLENAGSDSIKCSSDTHHNFFIGGSTILNINDITDLGIDNTYKNFYFTDEIGGVRKFVSYDVIFRGGAYTPFGDQVNTDKFITIDRGTSMSNYLKPDLIIFDGSSYNVELVLSINYTFVENAKPFYLLTKTFAGYARLKYYNGTVIASTDSGGFTLEENSLYYVVFNHGDAEVVKIR